MKIFYGWVIVAAGGLLPEPIPGYAVRLLDRNVLAGLSKSNDIL